MSWLLFDSFDAGGGPTPTTPLFDAGVGLLPLDVQSGGTVTLGWLTDVLKTWSGLEQRIALRRSPQQTYAFPVKLTDAQGRDVLGLLARYAHTAAQFRVSLPHEGLTVVSSTSTTVTVHSLAYCDWAVAGQRVVIERNGVTAETIVASAAGATFTVDDDVSAVALEGARIMPAMPVYLAPAQNFGRYQVNLGELDLVAHASIGPLGDGTMGTGASVTAFDGFPVWTWGVQADGGAISQPIDAGYSLIDAGLRVGALAKLSASDWLRSLRIRSHRQADWQWLKAFLDAVRGRWKVFLVPTGRPDLVADSYVADELIVSGADYVLDWYPSLAHRRLLVTYADGTTGMFGVTSAEVVTASTQRLYLSASLASLPTRVEFLETARLEEDQVAVQWEGAVFSADLRALVVQR